MIDDDNDDDKDDDNDDTDNDILLWCMTGILNSES
jgi:hypothetical protein